jgi:hypothetical protein
MDVSFARYCRHDASTDRWWFPATINTESASCWITLEALVQNFGAPATGRVHDTMFFEEKRAAVEAAVMLELQHHDGTPIEEIHVSTDGVRIVKRQGKASP